MITDSTREELLSQYTQKTFANVLRIIGTGFAYSFIDDNIKTNIGGTEYTPKGFDFSPPDPSAEDATSSVTIEDIDRALMYVLQETEDPVQVSIGMIRPDDPSVYLDGPYYYKLDQVSASGDGGITLELTKQGRLGFSASASAYTPTLFPGLFG